jgi:hypothetical protein
MKSPSLLATGSRLFSLLAAVFAVLGSLAAAETDKRKPPIDSERLAMLVSQLGSEDFTAREAASEELTAIGLPAFTALEAAGEHPDREVRYRALRILSHIRELDLQRRLESFLSGDEADDEYPLPGWNRFQKVYGDSSRSRQQFVEMQRADAEVLRAIEEGPRSASELLAQRTLEQQQAMQTGGRPQLSFGQAASLLFVAAEDDVTMSTQTMQMVFNLCSQPVIRDVLSSPDKKEIPRKMIGSLVRRSEDYAMTQAMMLSIQYEMEEGLVPATKILKNPVNRVPYMSQYALMTVAKLGSDTHLPLVESLLEDQSVVTKMQNEKKVTIEVQVRDAALATAVLLTKQEVKDYFPARDGQPLTTDPQQLFFNPRAIGFENDEERGKVHKKWTEYREKNPAKAPVDPTAPAVPTPDAPAPGAATPE